MGRGRVHFREVALDRPNCIESLPADRGDHGDDVLAAFAEIQVAATMLCKDFRQQPCGIGLRADEQCNLVGRKFGQLEMQRPVNRIRRRCRRILRLHSIAGIKVWLLFAREA